MKIWVPVPVVPDVRPGVSSGGGSKSDSDAPVGLIIIGVVLGCAILPFIIYFCLWIYVKCSEWCNSGIKQRIKRVCCVICHKYANRKNGKQSRTTQGGTYNTSHGDGSSGPPPVIFNHQNEMEKQNAPNNNGN